MEERPVKGTRCCGGLREVGVDGRIEYEYRKRRNGRSTMWRSDMVWRWVLGNAKRGLTVRRQLHICKWAGLD